MSANNSKESESYPEWYIGTDGWKMDQLEREIAELEKINAQDIDDANFFRKILSQGENPAARAGLKMTEFGLVRLEECKNELRTLEQQLILCGAKNWVNDDEENDYMITWADGSIDPSKKDEDTGFAFSLKGTGVTIRVTAASLGCDDVYVGILKNESGDHWDDLRTLWEDSGWEKNRWWCWKYCSFAKCLNYDFIVKCRKDTEGALWVAQEEIGNMFLEIAKAVLK